MRLLLVLLLVAAGLSAGTPVALAHDGLTWRAVNSPFALDFQDGGRTLTGQRETFYRRTDGTRHSLTKWRDRYNHSDEVVEDVTQFQARGVPLDTLWVDNPWKQGPEGARPTYACGTASPW